MDIVRFARTRRAMVLALAAAGALGACGRSDAAEGDGQDAAPLNVGPENVTVAERTTLATGPIVSGSLVPDREAAIRAEVGGPVLAVHAEEGERVAAGQLLALIDDSAIQAQVMSARSAVASARTEAQRAARELERTTTLVAAGALAERDLEAATTAHEAAQAQLAGAEAQLAAAERQLRNTRVTAPFAGVVSARPVHAGDVVSPGTALFTIVAPGSMRLEATVPAEQLSQVRVGAPVTFTVAGYPGRSFSGTVTRVNPTADPQTRQVKLQVGIPNVEGTLVGGLFAEGRVATEVRDGVVVPVTAVDRRGVSPVAYRVRGGVVERVEVQLGLQDEAGERVELVAGVMAGDTLLVGAAQGISPGTLVRVSAPSDRPRETAARR